MTAYYNEIDPYAAQWLRNLMGAGHIAKGEVDERSIVDVRPDDLRGFTQCHFFAGIGVWSHALRSAGWADDRPVWTGSCPCQPFSAAGRQQGTADERHLWPVWFDLIRECRPAIVLGEQVEAAIRHGWLDLVQADMEGSGYACGAVAAPAAGFGAPHIRARLYFAAIHLADADDARSQGWGGMPECADQRPAWTCGVAGGLADADSQRRSIDARLRERSMHNPEIARRGETDRRGPTNGFWRNADWIGCTDGKWRPVEPGIQQVVDGSPLRMGLLCAELNAKTQEVLNEAAIRLQAEAGEILREVRDAIGSKEIFVGRGGLFRVCEAQILLAYLLEFAREKGSQPNTTHRASQSNCASRDMRMLWRDKQVVNSSYQRRLVGQPLREFADTLRVLSSSVARFAHEAGYPLLYENAPASNPLGRSKGDDNAQGALGSVRPSNRMGRLRAYGNAIAAPQAQAFVEAVMEYAP